MPLPILREHPIEPFRLKRAFRPDYNSTNIVPFPGRRRNDVATINQRFFVASTCSYLKTDELDALCFRLAKECERVGVTGLLLYEDGTLTHSLEGASDDVLSVLEQLATAGVIASSICILDIKSAHREYDGWKMSYRRESSTEPESCYINIKSLYSTDCQILAGDTPMRQVTRRIWTSNRRARPI